MKKTIISCDICKEDRPKSYQICSGDIEAHWPYYDHSIDMNGFKFEDVCETCGKQAVGILYQAYKKIQSMKKDG